MEMTNKDYAICVEDEVCERILTTATSLLLHFTKSGLPDRDDYDNAREILEKSGYDCGFLPEMRDLMIDWLEESAPGKIPVRKDCALY